MDVTLFLTHRCNLACSYCYAGRHHETSMDAGTIAQAVELLFIDDAKVVQLSFFGGEPLLCFEAMRLAVGLARRRARAEGRRLLLQCTTNGTLLRSAELSFIRKVGLRVAVSIDGVRQAHDRHRRTASGRPTFDAAYGGLHALIAAGVDPEVVLVITPQTVGYLHQSVSWLWEIGVRRIEANPELGAVWDERSCAQFERELVAVAREAVERARFGQPAHFGPFRRGGHTHRRQLVVAPSGNLYPCAPLVGADDDEGPEAALRLGHLRDEPGAILARTAHKTTCNGGGDCLCARTLEARGSPRLGPYRGGGQSRWFEATCQAVGRRVAQLVAVDRGRQASSPLPEVTPTTRREGMRWPLVGSIIACLVWAAGAAYGVLGGEEQPVEPPEISSSMEDDRVEPTVRLGSPQRGAAALRVKRSGSIGGVLLVR